MEVAIPSHEKGMSPQACPLKCRPLCRERSDRGVVKVIRHRERGRELRSTEAAAYSGRARSAIAPRDRCVLPAWRSHVLRHAAFVFASKG